MLINNYFLKGNNPERITILWKLERYANLTRDNPFFSNFYKNIEHFKPFLTNNNNYLLVGNENEYYLIYFYRQTFYDIFKIDLPFDVDDIKSVSVMDILLANMTKTSIITIIKKADNRGISYRMEKNFDTMETHLYK